MSVSTWVGSVAAVLVSAISSVNVGQSQEMIAWSKSLPETQAAAKKSGKLVCVYFFAENGEEARAFDAETLGDPKVIAFFKSNLHGVKVGPDDAESKKTAEKYKVVATPAVVFLDGDGELVSKFAGTRTPRELIRFVEASVQAHRDLPALMRKRKENPDDSGTNQKLAVIHALRADRETALTHLVSAEKHAKPNDPTLAKTINMVADAFQDAQEFDKAVELFKRSVKVGSTPEDLGYGHASIAACYWSMRRFNECKEAAEKAIAIKGCPDEEMNSCKRMLDAVSQIQSRQKRPQGANKKANVGDGG